MIAEEEKLDLEEANQTEYSEQDSRRNTGIFGSHILGEENTDAETDETRKTGFKSFISHEMN
jgi:hypothetical protein